MTERIISDEVVKIVAKAIHDAAYDASYGNKHWTHNTVPREHHEKEARAAIAAYEDWLAKNRK
jgi:hypothetical protein